MPGWLCKVCQEVRTFRRKPGNVCNGCRSSKRGKHNLKTNWGVKKDDTADNAKKGTVTPAKASDSVTVSSRTEELRNLDPPTRRKRRKCSMSESIAPAAKPELPIAPVSVSTSTCVYTAMKEALSKECHEALVPALGMTDGFLAAAQAMAVIDRYQQSQLPLPGCHRSLASFAMAMSPIADEDVKRKLYLAHVSVKVSVQQIRAAECMWAMTLPFKDRVTEP